MNFPQSVQNDPYKTPTPGIKRAGGIEKKVDPTTTGTIVEENINLRGQKNLIKQERETTIINEPTEKSILK